MEIPKKVLERAQRHAEERAKVWQEDEEKHQKQADVSLRKDISLGNILGAIAFFAVSAVTAFFAYKDYYIMTGVLWLLLIFIALTTSGVGSFLLVLAKSMRK